MSELKGTIDPTFQIGGSAGPLVKGNAGAVEARNAADSAYAILRGAAPVGANDLATKAYADGLVSATADGAAVTAQENTASTSYTNLTTPGPAVTVVTGARALVFISAMVKNTTAGGFTAFLSVAVSGATTIAADDAHACEASGASQGYVMCVARSMLLTGLTPGSNTFTAKYRVDGATWGFFNRQITVIPLL
jgi:hypothetical protein